MKLLIFDFDGVIADSLGTLVKIVNSELNHHISSLVTAEELRQRGAKALFDKHKISGLKLLIYSRQVNAAFGRHIAEIPPCQGIKEVLNKVKCRTAIVTSNSSENTEAFLRMHSMNVDIIIGGIKLFGKARKIKEVLKKARVSKHEAIYIGDQMDDIEASRIAGIKIAAVTWGFNSRELLEKANPDYLIDRPEEILKLV